MQSIYALRADNNGTVDKGTLTSRLKKQFDLSFSLLGYQLWFLTEVARYAETDASIRGNKHLPTHEDLTVATKIAGNEVLWRILESDLYKDTVALYKFDGFEENKDMVKAAYKLLVESPVYITYNNTPGRDKRAEKEVLEYIYTDLMIANDNWVSFVEEKYTNWDDDAEMLRQIVMQYLQKPGVYTISNLISPDKRQFANELINTVFEKNEELETIIKPKLRNWDADRLALLDMILLQMGVSEFLYFETIPVKVTINEYIDLAKEYSTSQSGQFVNGILDNVRKELETENRIVKKSFK